jgi:hypothetical protein
MITSSFIIRGLDRQDRNRVWRELFEVLVFHPAKEARS